MLVSPRSCTFIAFAVICARVDAASVAVFAVLAHLAARRAVCSFRATTRCAVRCRHLQGKSMCRLLGAS